MRLRRTLPIALSTLALVAGPLALAQPAAADASGQIDIRFVETDNGIRFVAIGGAALPSFADDEALVVDFSEPERVTFTVDSGRKLLRSEMMSFSPDIGCEDPSGEIFVAAFQLTCRATIITDDGLRSILSPTAPTIIDMSAIPGDITTVAVGGVPAAGSAYPGIEYRGGAGVDYVQGGDYNDIIDGGAGDDDLFGGPGDDAIYGDAGADNIDGEEGDDLVGGGPDNDYVVGGPGYDRITGGSGVDEIDSEDGLADPVVACDNGPGRGAVSFDEGKDIPVDCPVELLPSAVTGAIGSGSRGTVAVDWGAPEFDGNTPITGYRLRLSGGKKGDPDIETVTVGADTLSYYFANLPSEDFQVAIWPINKVGEGPVTVVNVSVTGGIAAPVAVTSTFVSFSNASVQWIPPVAPDASGFVSVTGYELAVRSTDKKDRKWRSWTTLPEKYGAKVTSAEFGPDLKFFRNSRYQFRVRALAGKEVSPWTTSDVRFAAPLQAPKVNSSGLTRAGYFRVDFTLGPSKAMKYNDVAYFNSQMRAEGGPSTIEFGNLVSKKGNRIVADFPIYGTEDRPTCSFIAVLVGPDSKQLVTPRTTLPCWLP